MRIPMHISQKEAQLESDVLTKLEKYEKACTAFLYLRGREDVSYLLAHVNKVLMDRLLYNDHGRVHSLITCKNALIIENILREKGYRFNFEVEWDASRDDVLLVLICASYLHDIGNVLHREKHEEHGIHIIREVLSPLLKDLYDDFWQVPLSYIEECVLCHMGNYPASSLEAKVVGISDGLDMEEGRARIPFLRGDRGIHGLSALSIKSVRIRAGDKKPIAVDIFMENPAGVFQVEEVFLKKVKGLGATNLIEIVAHVGEEIVATF